MMAPNVGLSPTVVHSILDAFFEVKKCEMKQQVALELDQMRHQMGLEMDRAVENMFGGLVAQVKQLLIPVQAEDPSTSVIVPNGGGGHKSESKTTSPESKVKSVPRSSEQAQDQSPNEDSLVKRYINDSIAPSSDPVVKNRAMVRSSTEPELQEQIIKNSSIKVKPQDSIQLPKSTTHYAIKSAPRPTNNSLPEGGTLVVKSCVGTTNTVKREESGDPEDENNRPVKRQRTESSKDHQSDRPETASPPSKFPCETCGKSFTKRDHLKRHSRIHQGAKPYHCKWPDCSYVSADSSHILRHIRGLHFEQSRKKGAAQDGGDTRDPKEFVRVDKELLN